MKTVKKTIVDLQYEWDAAALSRAKITLRHAASLEKIEQAHQELLEVKIQLIEAESDIDGLKLRNAGIMERRKDEKRKVDAAQEEQTEANRSGRELGQQVQAMLGDGDDEYRQVIRALSDGKTPDEVRNEAEAEEAKLELIHAANPNVMREFERRAGEIDKLKKTMDGSTQKLTKLTQETEELMAKWEPELDKLVSKINDAFAYNFEQISCAGEVRVHKDDDFDLWAIEIMVKFRYVASPYPCCIDFHQPSIVKMKHSNNSTLTANPAANAPSQQSSTSWLFNLWLNPPSASLMRSIKVWTPETNAWSTSVWWRLPAASTHRNTSSSHPSF